jgi:two-component system sensor histidine kinase QseC
MNSIQARLTLRLLACVLALSALAGFAVYFVFRDTMVDQFDDGLHAEARSISSYFVRDHDGHYEFNAPPDINELFHHGGDIDIYCIRRMDGTVVVHSPSIEAKDCPGMERPVSYVGYGHVRGYASHHHRRGEHERTAPFSRGLESNWRAAFETFLPASERHLSVERFQIAVAAEWEQSHGLLKRLLWVLVGVSIVAGAATVALVVWTVRHGFSPLRNLAQQAAAIDTASLSTRFSLETAPLELQPIHRALNDLLDRIEAALKREQRFNADVAHELRTPVAELRSLTEVALASPANSEMLTEALRDARDVGAQMENMIAALLALRRRQEASHQVIDVVPLVNEAWQTAEPSAKARALTVSWDLPSEAQAVADPTMLLSVLRNLFDNAVSYTDPGGEISCAVRPRDEAIEIIVRNRPHGLVSADVAHLFEPFWRKEQARSDGAHVGLGLALAESYCRAFGGDLRAALDAEGWIVFTALLPGTHPV